MRLLRQLIAIFGVCLLTASLVSAAKKKKKKKEDEEPPTQVLELPKDPPSALVVETSRLVFHTAPMTDKGTLSQQVREGLKGLQRQTGGATIVKIRAFVAGVGDQRRVQAVVSETFTERRQPLPVLTVVQVGALPMEKSQVLLESTSVDKKAVNPNGLAFVSGQAITNPDPLQEVAPLVDQSLSRLKTALAGSQLTADDVVRVTCFVSSLSDAAKVRQAMATQFPRGAHAMVQLLRGVSRGLVECEATARLRAAPEQALVLLNPNGLDRSPNYSQVALVGPGKIALSGAQLAFHAEEKDVRLAFDRLKKALEQVGANIANVAMSSIYPLSQATSDKVRTIRFEFYNRARPPASTMLVFEGLPSMDATFAVDVLAVL